MSLELTPENMQGVFDENAGKAMLLFVYSAQDPESTKLLQATEPLVPESGPYAVLIRIDIDAHPEFQQMVVQWGVRSVPSVIVVQKGRISGLLQAEQATIENTKKELDQDQRRHRRERQAGVSASEGRHRAQEQQPERREEDP